jgi:lipoate---protein ligase
MHGEYKIPGGKLVVVDLEVVDGCLRGVELSGDFFLYPEETIWRLRDVIEGSPAGADQEDLARRLNEAASDAEMVGVTPQGIAVAVHRAVTGDVA